MKQESIRLGDEYKAIMDNGRGFDPIRFAREHSDVIEVSITPVGWMVHTRKPYLFPNGMSCCMFRNTCPIGSVVDALNSIRIRKELPAELDVDHIVQSGPATIVFWKDGEKTVVKAQKGEPFDAEKGIALCFMKRLYGNTGDFNDVFRKYIKEDPEKEPEKILSEIGEEDAEELTETN